MEWKNAVLMARSILGRKSWMIKLQGWILCCTADFQAVGKNSTRNVTWWTTWEPTLDSNLLNVTLVKSPLSKEHNSINIWLSIKTAPRSKNLMMKVLKNWFSCKILLKTWIKLMRTLTLVLLIQATVALIFRIILHFLPSQRSLQNFKVNPKLPYSSMNHVMLSGRKVII